MHANTSSEPPVKLRDLSNAMRKLGSAVLDMQPRLAQLSDTRGAALALVTSRGAIMSMNQSAAALFGYASGELVGKRLADLAHEDDRAEVEAQLYGGAHAPFRSFDVILAGRSGHRMTVHVYEQIIDSDGAGTPLRLMVFAQPLATARQTLSGAPTEGDGDISASRESHDAHTQAVWLTMGQQHERERFAAELHDGIGQALTLVKLMVEDASMHLRRGQAEETARLLEATVLQVRDTIGELRQICGELWPLSLVRLGLPAALTTLCRRVEQSVGSLNVRFASAVEDDQVPDHLKADIFRVVQEALNNIVKHALASEIHIDLRRDASHLILSICDDGSGYDTRPLRSDDARSNGLGLIGLQHRIEAQGGTFSMSTTRSGGTEVSARWPL
jgi:two-component system NarL family sensor kinase